MSMAYRGSYLWRLRQVIGHELVLMPGAMVALLRSNDREVLLSKRADDESWCLPAGAAERGGSFASTAVDELSEEVGIEVAKADLVPFGCLSEAELHTINYPSGDMTHCFALAFLARAWRGRARPDRQETTDARFFDRSAPPAPLHVPTAHALGLLAAFLETGTFQVR
jgi:8-oxo-dGTP pyrophosphatase MutT (NUDIX family)